MEIPGYKIIKELGHGGMATVYLAMHEMLERKVAIKVMAPSLAADPTFGERFLREAKIVAKLSHPHIIAVYDVGISGTNHYIAMEYHNGGELKDRIGSGMDPAEAVDIIKHIASALNFAHEKGYIHRDVKPENILFSHDGKALLTDFGIARAEDSATKMTKTGSVIGTPTYMSPEQAQGFPLDGRADLYSLGVVFYEMLTGNPPYSGDSGVSIAVKHMTEPVPQFEGELKKYQPFLNRAMAKNPDERPQSGREFIELLENAGKGDAISPDTNQTQVWVPEESKGTQVVDVRQQHQGEKSKTGLFVVVAAAAVVIAGIVVFYSLQNDVGDTQQISGQPLPQQTEPIESESNTREQARLEEEKSRQAMEQRKREEERKLATEQRKAADAEKQKLAQEQRKQEEQARLLAAQRQEEEQRREEARKAAEAEKQRLATEQKRRQEEAMRLARLQKQKEEEARKQRERQREERKAKIADILARVDEYLSADRLSLSRINRAQKLYQELKSVDADNIALKSSISRLAKAYATLAGRFTDDKEFDKAEETILRGLELAPGNDDLLSAQDALKERQKKKRRTFGGF